MHSVAHCRRRNSPNWIIGLSIISLPSAFPLFSSSYTSLSIGSSHRIVGRTAISAFDVLTRIQNACRNRDSCARPLHRTNRTSGTSTVRYSDSRRCICCPSSFSSMWELGSQSAVSIYPQSPRRGPDIETLQAGRSRTSSMYEAEGLLLDMSPQDSQEVFQVISFYSTY